MKIRVMRIVMGAGILLYAGMASALNGESLRLLLLGMQDNNTPRTLLRADIALTVKAHDGERTTQAIALFAPGKDARWYLQIQEPPLAALVLGAKRQTVQRKNGTAETVPIGASIGDIGISYEDLSRFIESDFKLWQITDESRTKILVGGHAKAESAYVYRAYSIDKERKVPLKVQFYEGSLSNLVKLRLDDEHTLIGKKWLPGKIEIQNFPENATITLDIHWTQAATAPPEVLAPESFAAATTLPWPAAKPAATGAPTTD